MAEHTYNYEYCIECDAGYRSYGCMFSSNGEKKSLKLRQILEKLSKSEYEGGQQDPRPWTSKSNDLDEAEKQLASLIRQKELEAYTRGYNTGWQKHKRVNSRGEAVAVQLRQIADTLAADAQLNKERETK